MTENKILKGKIVSKQIEMFTMGMQVACWRDGILCERGWTTGTLIGLPRLIGNGEVLAIIDWGVGKVIPHSYSVFYLKHFVVSYEPIRDNSKMSELSKLFSKHFEDIREREGLPKLSKLANVHLDDFKWEYAINNNYVDTDTVIDFQLEEIGTGEITPDFDFETKLIGRLVNINKGDGN